MFIGSLRTLIQQNICVTIPLMDKEIIARVVSEVERIARGVGFGQVTIVIEKGRPRWLEAGTREWLEPREGAPLVSEDLRARIGELLVGYLAEPFGAMRNQAVVGGELVYLRKPSGAELALLHREFADRALRILEALERPEPDESPESGVGGGPPVAGALPGAVLPGL
jgi:hypothetical protein